MASLLLACHCRLKRKPFIDIFSYMSSNESPKESNNILVKIFLLPIKGYQKFISPLLGSNCIYEPSCSEYVKIALIKHGIIKGSILGIARLLRCSRFYMGGPDPVPEKFSFKHIRNQRIAFRRHKFRKITKGTKITKSTTENKETDKLKSNKGSKSVQNL